MKIWKKIRHMSKTFSQLTKTYNPSMLASAVVFYLLIVLIPLSVLIMQVLAALKIESSRYPGLIMNLPQNKTINIFSSIFLFINMVWVSSQLMDALNIASDTVYTTIRPRKYWWRRLYSLLLTFGFIIMVVLIVVIMIVISYLLERLINSNIIYQKPLLITIVHFIQLVMQFTAIWIITSFLYKYIIPVKVKIKVVLKTCLLVMVAWFIITFAFQSFLITYQTESYTILYGALANLFIFLFWLYLMAYVFIYGLIYNFYLYKKRSISKA